MTSLRVRGRMVYDGDDGDDGAAGSIAVGPGYGRAA